MIMKKYIILALALVAMVGCAKDDNSEPTGDGSAVQFSSASIGSKMNYLGTTWTTNDPIGIFMYNETDQSYANENVCYVSTTAMSTTNFEYYDYTGKNAIYYLNGKDVSFGAYYPYSLTATVDKISVDVSDQSDPDYNFFMLAEPISVPWSSSPDSDTYIAFNFVHQLCYVTFTIEANESLTDISSLKTVISNMPTTVDFSLEGAMSNKGAGTDVKLFPQTIQDTTTIKMIMIPTEGEQTFGLKFTTDSSLNTTSFTQDFVGGYTYQYTINLGQDYVKFTGESEIEAWEPATETDNEFNTSVVPDYN